MREAAMRRILWLAGVLLAACGDGGSEPSPGDLVPTIIDVAEQPPPSPTERAVFVTVEVRDPGGQPHPNAIVQWEASHGEVLSSALTEEDGQLQAQWTFNLAVTPSGTLAELRACARRDMSLPCGYSDPVSLEVPE
jgi:hypothetical protein